MAIVHRLQRHQGTVGVATVSLQLRMTQSDGQLRLGLTLKRPLQQTIALFVKTLLVGCASSTEVAQQWLALGFSRSRQVTLSAGPATFGQIQLTVLDRHLHAPTAVAARPWVDYATGGHDQFDQCLDPPDQQPQHRDDRQRRPQAGLVAEAFVGHQHVTGMLGNRQTQRRCRSDHQKHDHIQAFHGVISCAVLAAGLAKGFTDSSALTLRRSR
ncbi:hypothetical protein D3C81_1162690 [compost metagenome]